MISFQKKKKLFIYYIENESEEKNPSSPPFSQIGPFSLFVSSEDGLKSSLSNILCFTGSFTLTYSLQNWIPFTAFCINNEIPTFNESLIYVFKCCS